jgi:hypothetical protein
MKKTLLELTQDILAEMDSDEVNHIDDTVESQSVATIIKNCYYEILGNRNWPHMRKLVQLEAAGDITKPNYLKLPERLKELSLFKYDKSKENSTNTLFNDVSYVEPEVFLRKTSGRSSSNSNYSAVIDFSGVTMYIVNNRAPTCWTSFDDVYIVTDSYDKEQDDTLQKSRNQAIAYIVPEWQHIDLFIPDLPIEAFPLLEEESKSTAFFTLKQMANQKAEQKANRQNKWLSRKAWRAEGGVKFQNYGRKGRT